MTFKYEFPFLEIVRVPPIAEYNEALLGHQDNSAGKTMIRYLDYRLIKKIS